MGWNSTGKFGNHSGKTLRRYPTRKHGGTSAHLQCGAPKRRNEFAVVKELKYGNEARNVDPKTVKLDFEDGGLPLEKEPLIYSLNKHKRWLLPELLKDNISELFHEESNEYALDAESRKSKAKKCKKERKLKKDNKLRVIVVERHSSGDALRYRPDCVGVTSNVPLNSSDSERNPGKKYSHVGDLKSKLNDEEIEVYYEFLSPFPKNEWPCNRQFRYYRRNSIDEVFGSKSKKKGRGQKNKCYLHGGQRDQRFEVLDEFGLFDPGDDVLEEHSSTPLKREFAFPIGSCIRDAIQIKTKKDTEEIIVQNKEPAAVIPSPVVYGKGEAKYIDNGEVQTPYSTETKEINHDPKPSCEPLAKDEKFQICLVPEDITADNLFKKFGGNYIEGHVLPRKFMIKAELNETQTCDNIDDIYLLFELFDTLANENTIEATVAFSLPKADELEVNKLESELNRLQKCGPLTVHSIVDLLMERIGNMPKRISRNPKKSSTKVSVQFIQQLCKWESEVCDLKKAVQYALGRKVEVDTPRLLLENGNGSGNERRFCEICCVEEATEQHIGQSDFTCLSNCLHHFCNGCWSLYIATSINAGQSQITCPCFNCKTVISEPLIWSHTNSKLHQQYKKLKLEHLISTNPQLRHCPAANCVQLAYIDGAKGLESVPVSCKCGLVWCFSCQNQAHWPATCKEMDAFCKAFKDYEHYLKMLRRPGLVSSVRVKKCPICCHPIEKSYGCDHMTCNCGGEFCWECLTPWQSHTWGECANEKKDFEEVALTLSHGSARFDKHCTIALRNNLERNGKNFFAFKHLTEKAKQVENAHELAGHNPKTSTGKFVQTYVEKNIASMVENIFRFKNLAHFVLENTAVYLAIAKMTKLVKSLERDVEKLDFIIQRCHEVLLEPVALLQEGKLETFRELLKHGEELIWHIDKLVQASRKQQNE